uniref:Agglutinin domain-containing protein n=1 Tax=Zea mays TaxID=4577 RepID=A0A804MIE1_MAIZE
MARLVSSGIIGKGHNIFDDGGFGEVHADPIKVERPHKRPPQKQNAENGTTTKVDEPKELPKHVCFKGDNGLYLSARMVEGYPYLQFASDDIGDPSVRFTTYNYMIDGKRVIRVKSDHFGKFWRRSPNWIWCDTDDTSTDNRDTLFEVVRVGDDADAVYGLRNLGNNHICHRLTYEGKESCLNASIPSVRKEAQLKIEEAVLLRKIYGVDYHLKDAKILNNKVLEAGHQKQLPSRSPRGRDRIDYAGERVRHQLHLGREHRQHGGVLHRLRGHRASAHRHHGAHPGHAGHLPGPLLLHAGGYFDYRGEEGHQV